MLRRRQQISVTDLNYCNLADVPKAVEPGGIPFVDRLACTIAEACEATVREFALGARPTVPL
jgi:hypothetical protein